MRRLIVLGTVVAAVGLAIPATVAAKVTSLTSCQTINTPGKYRLDADVTSVVDCFRIIGSDVTLNLNGHTITGPGRLDERGIDAAFATNPKIVGPGTVTGWDAGINVGGGGAASNGSVRGVTATTNQDGISINGSGNSVRGNVVTDNGGFGIFVGTGSTSNTIIGNFAHNNFFDDLAEGNANCDSNVWRGNDFGTANESCIH